MNKKVRVRFAPSPTGYLHIGGLRTALYNFLYAKKHKGDYFLRIEDTDQKRVVPGAIKKLIDSLDWAGLKHNEGVFVNEKGDIYEKGEYKPYIQSKRLEIYKKYAHELVEKKKAYYCFCTPERLDSLRAVQEKARLAPTYDKLCLKEISREEAEKKIANGEKCVIRFDVPETGETEFEDVVRGKVKFTNKNLDDFVILKSDGYPTYHLAHVVDDHLMKTTLVLRGEEWLSSTPKHLLLYQAFDWNPPQYGHLCVILNKNTKKKLSKRDGDVSVGDFMKKGYLPEAVVNFIALLGWNPKTEQEFFTLEELIEEFDISKLNKSGAIFDRDKLDWMNSIYLRKKEDWELIEPSRPYLEEDEEKLSDEYIEKIVAVEKERIKKLSDIAENKEVYLKKPTYEKDLLKWKDMDNNNLAISLKKALDIISSVEESKWTLENLKNKLLAAADPENRGELLWPLRVALTGKEKSPSPWEVAWAVGKRETLFRIQKAIEKIK
ncbi:MAG: glutamate--tRNA ligase [Candidatus Moranbacteria bacterium CG_4_10_14_3_um_filter_44_15]|nr:MAG: glutamate--tRNA ligase [Candidatus Moranbacteria bacterium CG_4_10_14_3_um_filter_44_15]